MAFASLVLFEGLRLLLRAMLVVLSIHFVRAAWATIRRRDPPSPPEPQQWPTVTIQLPMRNEYYVARRVIRAACAIDYPSDRKHVQVLDDSDDVTTERVRQEVERLAAEGHSIELVRRSSPTGYKAGALNEGLSRARGELIAIFDADCVPPPDFLHRLVPWFSDARVGCVQARWSFLNRRRSLATRVQAIVLDGLFAVDQFSRASRGLPLQFNGTNGMWRRSCIERVGGWNPAILAEDADLSFRAQLRGWRLVHLRDYAVPTEIPDDMAAFRAQQRRWSLGTAQLLRVLGWPIVRAQAPLRAKTMMFMHLGRHAIDPLLLMMVLSSPFTTLYGMPFLVDYGAWVNAGLLGAVLASCLVFYGTALRHVGASRLELVLVPLVIALAIGLSLVYTVAFTRGLFQRGGEFVRTPKAGDELERAAGPSYLSPVAPLALLELGLALAHGYFGFEALDRGFWPHACFFAGVAFSFAWVAIGSLRRHRQRPG